MDVGRYLLGLKTMTVRDCCCDYELLSVVFIYKKREAG